MYPFCLLVSVCLHVCVHVHVDLMSVGGGVSVNISLPPCLPAAGGATTQGWCYARLTETTLAKGSSVSITLATNASALLVDCSSPQLYCNAIASH